ncbi:hypothetical protein B9479_001446 [Cryptococcus floricola]|uniref:Pectate lyase n=1 Tax=Cryptococcus floricola TaxID=2591691 RepID=A0A5D3B6A6_9TREE|nr:hypothetical protein B9479_001446 [Cryptococcus floricola]
MLASTLLSLLPFLAMSSAAPQVIPRSSSYTLPVPTSQGNVTYSSAQSISGTFDGELKTYGRGVSCTGQAEGGNSDAVFLLEDGATLKNVIIGEDQIEGVHCLGSCTIENVWWIAVCEDALTFKGDGDGSVIGGGATGAEDKVIQHNGIGDVTIDGFTVVDFGKLYRSCGNCKNNGDTRNVNISNVKAYNGKVLAGINSNYGDVATITDTCATSVKQICTEYEGTSDNDEEPTKLQSGVSDNCVYTESEITTC